MRYFQRQRLNWIAEQQSFNRKDLCERFEISVPQASLDIKAFKSLYPGWLQYDTRRKTYRRAVPSHAPDCSTITRTYWRSMAYEGLDFALHFTTDREIDFEELQNIQKAIDQYRDEKDIWISGWESQGYRSVFPYALKALGIITDFEELIKCENALHINGSGTYTPINYGYLESLEAWVTYGEDFIEWYKIT